MTAIICVQPVGLDLVYWIEFHTMERGFTDSRGEVDEDMMKIKRRLAHARRRLM
jgi:hypothetical protein